MSNNKQSSVEWLMEIDKSWSITLEEWQQAKAMHKEEHGKTWDASMRNLQERGMNEVRAWEDFDEYYNETYGGKDER